MTETDAGSVIVSVPSSKGAEFPLRHPYTVTDSETGAIPLGCAAAGALSGFAVPAGSVPDCARTAADIASPTINIIVRRPAWTVLLLFEDIRIPPRGSHDIAAASTRPDFYVSRKTKKPTTKRCGHIRDEDDETSVSSGTRTAPHMHRATATARTGGSELGMEQRHGSIITTIMYACQPVLYTKIVYMYLFATSNECNRAKFGHNF
jgi:hypothetical protein